MKYRKHLNNSLNPYNNLRTHSSIGNSLETDTLQIQSGVNEPSMITKDTSMQQLAVSSSLEKFKMSSSRKQLWG